MEAGDNTLLTNNAAAHTSDVIFTLFFNGKPPLINICSIIQGFFVLTIEFINIYGTFKTFYKTAVKLN